MKITKFILIFLFLSINCFSQTNYYVSTTGNNANNGSLALPWQTIQYSLNQLPANSVLNVFSGTYTEKINIPISNITLKNHSATLPMIDAEGITSQNAILSINNKSNVTIDGIELRNNIQNDAQGILVDGSGANITIKNCKIHDIHFSSNINATINTSTNAQGIIVYGNVGATAITNLKIQNNELYNCRLGYSEGIALNGNVNGFEVTNNVVHDLTNIGIDLIGHEGNCPTPANDQARNGLVKSNTIYNCICPYATSGGIYIDGGKTIIVENNTSYHNGYGIEVGCENIGKTTDAITIRNNVFYNNQICAIALGGFAYPAGSGKVTNSIIRNNTCYFNDYSNSGNGELYLSYSENSIIENNIFYTTAQNNLAYAESSQPILNFNYNTFYCPSGTASLYASWNGTNYTGYTAFKTGTSTNTNSVFGNPQFTTANISNPDFHIATTSPSKNAGNPSYIAGSTETDYFNELRIEGGRVDCGADEFGTTLSVSDNFISTIDVKTYPNPVSNFLIIETNEEINKIELYNLLAQKIKIKSQNKTIDFSDLPAGNYFLSLETTTGKCIKQIIKK
jgi:hypothetical protein